MISPGFISDIGLLCLSFFFCLSRGLCNFQRTVFCFIDFFFGCFSVFSFIDFTLIFIISFLLLWVCDVPVFLRSHGGSWDD